MAPRKAWSQQCFMSSKLFEEKFLDAGVVDESKVKLNKELLICEELLSKLNEKFKDYRIDDIGKGFFKEYGRIKEFAMTHNKNLEEALVEVKELNNKIGEYIRPMTEEEISEKLFKKIFEGK